MKKESTLPTLLALIVVAICVCMALTSNAQCQGKTKKNEPCKSTFVIKGTNFCRFHNPKATLCSFIKRDSTQCRNVVNLKRNPHFCFIHGKKITPTF